MSADVQFDNVDHLFIGKEEDADEGFIGCISRVEFNDVYPLKYLFQQNPPANVRSSGMVNEYHVFVFFPEFLFIKNLRQEWFKKISAVSNR